MLNYIWLSLIVLGIASALFIDLSDISSNKYHNNDPVTLTLEFPSPVLKDIHAVYEGIAIVSAKDYNSLYGDSLVRDINIPVILNVNEEEKKSNITLKNSPPTKRIFFMKPKRIVSGKASIWVPSFNCGAKKL